MIPQIPSAQRSQRAPAAPSHPSRRPCSLSLERGRSSAATGIAVFASLIGLTFRLPCLVRAHARLPARDRLALNIKVVSTKNKNMTVVCRGGNAEAQSTLRGCPNSSCLADLSCFCCKEAPPSCSGEFRIRCLLNLHRWARLGLHSRLDDEWLLDGGHNADLARAAEYISDVAGS